MGYSVGIYVKRSTPLTDSERNSLVEHLKRFTSRSWSVEPYYLDLSPSSGVLASAIIKVDEPDLEQITDAVDDLEKLFPDAEVEAEDDFGISFSSRSKSSPTKARKAAAEPAARTVCLPTGARGEKIAYTAAKLGVVREPGFLYWVHDGHVLRKPNGTSDENAVVVVEGKFERWADYLYYLDSNGDVIATPRVGKYARTTSSSDER